MSEKTIEKTININLLLLKQGIRKGYLIQSEEYHPKLIEKIKKEYNWIEIPHPFEPTSDLLVTTYKINEKDEEILKNINNIHRPDHHKAIDLMGQILSYPCGGDIDTYRGWWTYHVYYGSIILFSFFCKDNNIRRDFLKKLNSAKIPGKIQKFTIKKERRPGFKQLTDELYDGKLSPEVKQLIEDIITGSSVPLNEEEQALYDAIMKGEKTIPIVNKFIELLKKSENYPF